jgi:hypothetical protein
LSFRLAAVALKVPAALPHLEIKFATFEVPSPVALSYPVDVVHAGVFVWFGSTNTPFVPLELLLQFKDAPAQGTESFPLVTS